MKKYCVLILLFLFFSPTLVRAYQPLMVNGVAKIGVKDPNRAVGYYVRMPDKSVSFLLPYEESGQIKAELRIPKIPDAQKSILIEIFYTDISGEKRKLTKKPKDSNWEYYKDNFSGNEYFIAHKFNVEVASGTHLIRVSSPPDNEKPFVLILGDEKQESWKTHFYKMIELGKIKNSIYRELPISAYYNIYGIIILIPTVLLLMLLTLFAVKTYLRIKREDEMEEREVDESAEDAET